MTLHSLYRLITCSTMCFSFFFVKLGILYCTVRGDCDKDEPIVLRFYWYPSCFEEDFFPNETQSYTLCSAHECNPCFSCLYILCILKCSITYFMSAKYLVKNVRMPTYNSSKFTTFYPTFFDHEFWENTTFQLCPKTRSKRYLTCNFIFQHSH